MSNTIKLTGWFLSGVFIANVGMRIGYQQGKRDTERNWSTTLELSEQNTAEAIRQRDQLLVFVKSINK